MLHSKSIQNSLSISLSPVFLIMVMEVAPMRISILNFIHSLHFKMIFLRKPSLFIYFSLISSSWGLFLKDAVEQSPLDPGEDASYARLIFQNGTERYFRPWECPDGIWSEEQFSLKQQPKCICVKGAYVNYEYIVKINVFDLSKRF
jgi:hypothetical protein